MEKQIPTKDQVLVIAQRLMLTNGQTTTLEVKEELRKQDFFAIQDDVSAHMRQLADEENWVIGDNGTHRIYSGKAIQNVMNTATNAVNYLQNNNNVQSDNTPVIVHPATSSVVIQKSQAVPGDWEVNAAGHTNVVTVLYIQSIATRDQARSIYAKYVGVNRNDVRARKVK